MDESNLEPQKHGLYNKNMMDYYMLDYPKPLISPINYGSYIFPTSTKNHFNINLDMMLNPGFNSEYPQSNVINRNKKDHIQFTEVDTSKDFITMFHEPYDNSYKRVIGDQGTSDNAIIVTTRSTLNGRLNKSLSLELDTDTVNVNDYYTNFSTKNKEMIGQDKEVLINNLNEVVSHVNEVNENRDLLNVSDTMLTSYVNKEKIQFKLSPKSAFFQSEFKNN